VRSLLASLVRRARELWVLAKNERASPAEIGWSLGVGVWIAFCPFIGLHLGIAFLVATVLRLNRLWAMVGSRASAAPLLISVAFLEIEAAHRLRTGAWAPVAPREVLAHGRELLLDWCLGTPLVATPLAVLAGVVGYAIARRWQRLKSRRLDAPPPPSSESPPSTPPATSP
jgi:uncharacterized protein (DUF2062 family)